MNQCSPLRYPGAKQWIVPYVEQVIRENGFVGRTIIEPYAGSGIVSLSMLENHVCQNAIMIDKDPLVYAFWRCVFERPHELIECIQNTPIDMNSWYQYSAYRDVVGIYEEDLLDVGMAGLFLNRTCYSGILKAGPIGGHGQESAYTVDCRFQKENIISWIRRLSLLGERVQMVCTNAINYLRELQDGGQSFLYLDPPYYEKGKSLYRYWYKDDDHEELAEYLHDCQNPWLLSYDDHPRIREMYCDDRVFRRDLRVGYTVGTKRTAPEILISNLEIPPWMYRAEAE